MDLISREWLKTAIHNFFYELTYTPTEEDIQAYIDAAPSVNPQEMIQKIADIVEGTIENINYDEAMDMLYDIKDVF